MSDQTADLHEHRMRAEARYLQILDIKQDKKRLPLMAALGKEDLYFLLMVVLGRKDIRHDWLFARCREVQARPDGYLDLWSREHYKTTILTYGLNILEIVNNPEVTIGIFSYKKDNAVGQFLRPLKQTFEENRLIKTLWPDIFYENPERESPLWTIDHGLTVKRRTARKEATVSAWGVIQGQPIGSHFDILDYDDVVTSDTVSEGMLGKTTEQVSASFNLGVRGGRKRMRGTRWSFNDTYAEMLSREAFKPRVYPATANGKVDGEPVFMSREELGNRLREQGSYVFAAQMLLDPVATSQRRLNPDLLNFYTGSETGEGMALYLVVDPAGSKKKNSDFTVMAVIGIGADGNKYLLDLVRDRLNLLERIDTAIRLHKRWKPEDVGWEAYGKDSDIEAVELEMERRRPRYMFGIKKLAGTGQSKEQRIERMLPDLEQGRWWFPQTLWTARDGKQVDLIRELVEEEMRNFPFALHDDGLDAISRVYDLNPEIPTIEGRVRGHIPVLAPPIAERGYDPRAW